VFFLTVSAALLAAVVVAASISSSSSSSADTAAAKKKELGRRIFSDPRGRFEEGGGRTAHHCFYPPSTCPVRASPTTNPRKAATIGHCVVTVPHLERGTPGRHSRDCGSRGASKLWILLYQQHGNNSKKPQKTKTRVQSPNMDLVLVVQDHP
jgi:hypothetical protein